MSTQYGVTARAVRVAATAAALAALLTACGGGGGDDAKDSGPQAAGTVRSAPPGQSTPPPEGSPTGPDTSATLATIDGSNGLRIVIHSAVREEGGFLTVNGTLKNTTSKLVVTPPQWSGQEIQVQKTGPSLAGVTLVDKVEKKRYYVLRDTEGYPLTTTGINSMQANQEVSVFAQFPAPPATVTQVDIQFPLMPTATIELS
ncbi:hypothetical protein [Streptomyces roseolilacinus]|uniref:Secreted protein n=1 Tax=Streptomyces roseolilacinus TaxID=66904 RepID=A0A918AVJ3_9ACTN|nr:hypothetical protein [Streptomyces roseolilacinus]GGP89276.1 hypothetical protein GCM10010249_03790 [Streptomyces roseolilacinus]